MTVPISRKSFTVTQYHQMATAGILCDTDRVELINGDIIDMSPINSEHAGMVNRLLRVLTKKLLGKAIMTIQNPIHLDDISEPEPDLTIAKIREDDYISAHPRPKDVFVVIEVADTSLDKDREIKAPLYAKHGIPEYWIVNLKDKQIELFRQPSNGEYGQALIFSAKGKIESEILEFSLEYQEIFP